MNWNVYLSGEIHSDWRQQLIDGAKALNLPAVFTSAVTEHQASDAAGDLLGAEASSFWRDPHENANRKMWYCSRAIWRQVQTMECRI